MQDFSLALQKQLSDRQRKRAGGVERIFSRKQIEQAFLETFEMVGGIPRLAIWANDPENYGTFLNLLMKMAPKEAVVAAQGAVLEYRSNIPASPLNRAPVEDISEGEMVE
jgi:hypothetical protein